MLIEKVIQFKCYGNTSGAYYHVTNAKTNKFLHESDGFQSDQIDRLQHIDPSKIIDTWYNLVYSSRIRISFIRSYEEAIAKDKEYKAMRKAAKTFYEANNKL